MNVQLVESLVEVIKSLSSEEKDLLKSQLVKKEKNCDELLRKINLSIEQDQVLRRGKALAPSVQEIIHTLREERDQQLLETL